MKENCLNLIILAYWETPFYPYFSHFFHELVKFHHYLEGVPGLDLEVRDV